MSFRHFDDQLDQEDSMIGTSAAGGYSRTTSSAHKNKNPYSDGTPSSLSEETAAIDDANGYLDSEQVRAGEQRMDDYNYETTAGGGAASAETGDTVLPSSLVDKDVVKALKGDYEKFVYKLPASFEQVFARFDDKIIEICQKSHALPILLYSKLFTILTVIEIGISLPFLLFLLGFDDAAQIWLSFAFPLAFIPQLPKRFLWRTRPYAVGRAKKKSKEHTSSFPSRAVTCGTLYPFVCAFIGHQYLRTVIPQAGWFALYWAGCAAVILYCALSSSFARINLGVHYPSDCLFGFVQGMLIIAVGLILYYLHGLLCPSCLFNACYAASDAVSFSFHNLVAMNWIVLAIASAVFVVFGLLLVVPPVKFYTKFHHVFGMILPCEAFVITFLCPTLSFDNNSALGRGPYGYPRWQSWVFALFATALTTAIGMLGPKKLSVVVFFVMYAIVLLSLFIWRVGYINDL